MWINCTLFRADPVRPAIRISGAAKADILLAHRRHKQLIVERGRGPVRQAVAEAYDVVQHWNYWKPLDAVEYRLNELEPDPTRHGDGTTCRNAAMYPELIKVAHVLANPRWRWRALNGPREKLADAFGELCSTAIDTIQLPYRAYLSHCTNGGSISSASEAWLHSRHWLKRNPSCQGRPDSWSFPNSRSSAAAKQLRVAPAPAVGLRCIIRSQRNSTARAPRGRAAVR